MSPTVVLVRVSEQTHVNNCGAGKGFGTTTCHTTVNWDVGLGTTACHAIVDGGKCL